MQITIIRQRTVYMNEGPATSLQRTGDILRSYPQLFELVDALEEITAIKASRTNRTGSASRNQSSPIEKLFEHQETLLAASDKIIAQIEKDTGLLIAIDK